MNVLLVESHYRTRSWYLAMQGLADIFIISTMPEERELFISQGVPNENILNIHHPNLDSYDTVETVQNLKKIESQFSINVSELALMDRTLRKKTPEYINRYSYYIVNKIQKFISDKNIDVTFLEPTWMHDLVVERVCFSKNIPVLCPRNDRFLKNKFIFFKGRSFDDYFIRDCHENGKLSAGRTIDCVLSEEKPLYFHKYSARNKFRLSKLVVLFRLFRLTILRAKNNNIQPPFLTSVYKKFIAILKVYYLSKFSPFRNLSELKQRYIMITLHVQPESSIDVAGSKFSNQIEFVKQCVKTTPIDHLVVVKEHPHAVGNRPSGFYNELLSIPNLVILDPFEDSKAAIRQASLVISVTGTSSYEAAIMGVPAITAVEVFFKKLMMRKSFNPYTDSVDGLIQEIGPHKNKINKNYIRSTLAEIQSNIFSGNVQDCKTEPKVLSKENIKNLRSSFSEVINSFKK